MSGWRLALRQVPALRVDLRGIVPTALDGLSCAEIERLPVGHGNATLPSSSPVTWRGSTASAGRWRVAACMSRATSATTPVAA